MHGKARHGFEKTEAWEGTAKKPWTSENSISKGSLRVCFGLAAYFSEEKSYPASGGISLDDRTAQIETTSPDPL